METKKLEMPANIGSSCVYEDSTNTNEKSFRVKRTYPKILRNRKARIARRLKPRSWPEQPHPIMSGSNIHYEMADRVQAVNCGGIGAVHLMAQKIGLVGQIDRQVEVLKRHLPYHESDHVLSLAYNILVGGMRIEDLELRRSNEAFLDGLGAQRLPDPTTAGDFTRRFAQADTLALMEAINAARQRVWSEQPKNFLDEAVIDVDGTIAGTLGQCKQGMSMSYKGIWGYAPLITSLANTKEVLYLVNRPGNVASHQGSAEWIDRSIELVKPHAQTIFVRGDTDFALTKNFDRWTDAGVKFLFGIDAFAALVAQAEMLHAAHWRGLARLEREIKTEPRERPENVKEQIVREKGYLNKRLESEHVAQFDYRPGACERPYRVVALRKNISVERGEDVLFDEIKYFFYITNRRDLAIEEVVQQANERCNQENVIEQLKNGVNAMRMPVDNLLSNWAYMVMAALAWNLKAWFGLLMPDAEQGRRIVRMEFRSFMAAIIQVPAQIVRTARRIIYRVMGYNGWLKDFFATWERLRRMEAT
jgi:hypothetical protein